MLLVWSLGAAAACVYVAGRGGVVASSVATCVARGLRRGGASDGLRREFVAKVIVVDPCASEPPACRGADYVWAAKDEPDHAVEATSLRTDGTYAARERRLRPRGRGAARTPRPGRAGPGAFSNDP